ncbi:FAD/NAD(P)-binding domain-containing protein [Biscogniauxia marginata]|nr:FAD/NAD(P)-binding domain-containing protein [Biscogniauxia marginata]
MLRRSPPKTWQKVERSTSSQLHVLVVGAGLGGLGAAISILLAGHNITVLESAADIGEIGAGIQVLPNSSRILCSWGLRDTVSKYAAMPRYCNMMGWKGTRLSRADFHRYGEALGTPFFDFHRADLHRCLLDRAVELGADIRVSSRVDRIDYGADDLTATAVLGDGKRLTADLIVGADGISSKLREILLGKPDPPVETGDLAYRLLINAKDIFADTELQEFIREPQVNYWIGPDAHVVNYVLRGGELLNMVLLAPDDMPTGAMTLDGNVEEMKSRFHGWDPRISKLLDFCQKVQKWKLCIRPSLERWSHQSGCFTLLGDAVHATLPYLASGCGMALEDGAALGLCLTKLTNKSRKQKIHALRIYEECRRERTERVVERANLQKEMNHLHDGVEQRKRDENLKKFEEIDKRWIENLEATMEPHQGLGEDPFPWRYHGVGYWLLTYDVEKDVEDRWSRSFGNAVSPSML